MAGQYAFWGVGHLGCIILAENLPPSADPMCSSCPALALLLAVVLLQWTKACPEAFLPHLEALATQVRELWDAGRIRAGVPCLLTHAGCR